MKKRIVAIFAVLAIVLNTAACAPALKGISGDATELTKGLTSNAVSSDIHLGYYSNEMTDFGVRLFKECYGENALVSPLSVLTALAMAMNGAEGETLSQIENAVGITRQDLCYHLSAFVECLPRADDYKLSLANSVWLTNDPRFTVKDSFLQASANFYGADVFSAPFDDTTKNDINSWVSRETDGMIESVIDKIPQSAVAYLINALAFEATWQKIYQKVQVRSGTFTSADGEDKKVDFMCAAESLYIGDESASGFIKPYKDGAYAFCALLPNRDIDIEDYVKSLDSEKISKMLNSPTECIVNTKLPKFEAEFDTELSKALKSLGIKDAFDTHKADFSSLGSSGAGNIFINRVLHKTFISVAEKGTKAGAVTAIEAADSAAPVTDIRTVHLDRPFVYMIIERSSNTPLFIGALTDIQ